MTLHHTDHTPLQQIPQLHNTVGICVCTPDPLIGGLSLNVPEQLDESFGAAVSYRGLANPGNRDEIRSGPRSQRGRPRVRRLMTASQLESQNNILPR